MVSFCVVVVVCLFVLNLKKYIFFCLQGLVVAMSDLVHDVEAILIFIYYTFLNC